MGNILLGFKALLRAWGDGDFAAEVRGLLAGEKPAPPPAPAPERITQRNDALTLLAILQREARFLDFVQESVDDYSDEDIGAAVRELHGRCAETIERMFAIRHVTSKEEGAAIEAPAGFDPARYRFTGNIPASPPFRGRLAHPGWKATRCDVPEWKGPAESATVISPAVIEF